jgi:hypothetical protein
MQKTIYYDEETATFLETLKEEGFDTPGKFLAYMAKNYQPLKEQEKRYQELNKNYFHMKYLMDRQDYKLSVLLDVLNTMMKVEDIYECVSIEDEKSAVVEGAMRAADKRQEAEKIRAYHISQTPKASREEE